MDYSQLSHRDYKNFKSIQNCVYQFMSPSGKSYIGVAKNFYNRYLGHIHNRNRIMVYDINGKDIKYIKMMKDFYLVS